MIRLFYKLVGRRLSKIKDITIIVERNKNSERKQLRLRY